eukprot:TRINITY_DN424_c0_g1_i1.p1 TRINITY_DN424_c0_g1~~TRINITY_DN424_c0_g1_i1.p1  ORF type:complete len:217 (+),score=76.99 TRINITY_DN424_c0_g1_i1:141-791(+)
MAEFITPPQMSGGPGPSPYGNAGFQQQQPGCYPPQQQQPAYGSGYPPQQQQQQFGMGGGYGCPPPQQQQFGMGGGYPPQQQQQHYGPPAGQYGNNHNSYSDSDSDSDSDSEYEEVQVTEAELSREMAEGGQLIDPRTNMPVNYNQIQGGDELSRALTTGQKWGIGAGAGALATLAVGAAAVGGTTYLVRRKRKGRKGKKHGKKGKKHGKKGKKGKK